MAGHSEFTKEDMDRLDVLNTFLSSVENLSTDSDSLYGGVKNTDTFTQDNELLLKLLSIETIHDENLFVDDKNIFQLKRDSMLNAYNKDFDSSSYSAKFIFSSRNDGYGLIVLGLFMLVSAICLCNLGMQNSRKRSRNRSRNSSGRKLSPRWSFESIYIFFASSITRER